jgi:hypothetical protein
MNFQRCLPQFSSMALGVAMLSVTACTNIFVTKHKVLVDAISAPDATQPSGQSYRLLAKRSVVNQTPAEVSVIKACVDAALSSRGMFEAPPNTPSDLFIEVGYGRDMTPRVDPAARETFLQLSARDNPDRALNRSTGRELWDVRVSVLGVSGRLETAMPLLCSVAASYVATNTQVETKIDVPQNSPAIAAVRESALKALENKPPPLPAPPPVPSAASPDPN